MCRQVRAAASGAAGAALQALGDEGVSRGAHVELVLRHAFELLGSCCMHLPAMQEHMLDLLYRLASFCITFHTSSSVLHPMFTWLGVHVLAHCTCT